MYILTAAILATLLFIFCSSDPSKEIVFNAEKLYHTSIKQIETLSIKPDLITDNQLKEVQNSLSGTFDYCLENSSKIDKNSKKDEYSDLLSIAFLSSNQLTRLYFNKREYDSAITIISRFTTAFEPEGIPLLNSRLNLAQAYQSQGDLDRALAIHGSLLETFYPPVDNDGKIIERVLNLPMEEISIYATLQDAEGIKKAQSNAEEYYYTLVREWSGSDLEEASYSNLARIYYEIREWDKAIDVLSNMKDSTGNIDFSAEMIIARITMNGKGDYKSAISKFDDLLAKTEDTLIIPSILEFQAIANFELKRYDKALNLLNKIREEHNSYFGQFPLPQKYIARIFIEKDDWVRAENELKWLIDNYPASEEAFDAHLVIADYYFDKKNRELGQSWENQAEDFYKKMAIRYKGTNVEASAVSYQAEIARRNEKWPAAARLLESIFDKFPQTDIGRRSLVAAATIYREKMNDKSRADFLIKRLKAELIPGINGKNIEDMTDVK